MNRFYACLVARFALPATPQDAQLLSAAERAKAEQYVADAEAFLGLDADERPASQPHQPFVAAVGGGGGVGVASVEEALEDILFGGGALSGAPGALLQVSHRQGRRAPVPVPGALLRRCS